MSGRRSVEDHLARIEALLAPVVADLGEEPVGLADALDRVAAAPIRATTPLPAFRNSQMDGYAVRADDVAQAPVVLPVDGVQAAAAAERRRLGPGRALKVMTGAPLPEGADAVVPVEQTEPADDGVRVLAAPARGAFVREVGSDLAAGAVVVPAGTRLAPRHLAAAAAAGADRAVVVRRLRVAVLATGAEVVPPAATPEFGQVHDANGVALAAMVREAGAEPVLTLLVPDDVAAFATALTRATEAADLVVTAGGISKGDFEVVRQVLEPLGADVAEVAMQPGGPQATATVDGVPVVCLPGNPVSAQVSFTVLLRPVLRAAAGLPPILPQRVPLAESVDSPAGRRQWRRGTVRDGAAVPVGGPGSHLTATMAAADVLIDVPADVVHLAAGEPVDVLPL